MYIDGDEALPGCSLPESNERFSCTVPEGIGGIQAARIEPSTIVVSIMAGMGILSREMYVRQSKFSILHNRVSGI